MTEDFPNISLLRKLDLHNLDAAPELFADDFVWHFINPNLPDLQGDYAGLDGLRTFFKKLAQITGGTFRVNPVSVTPAGPELVVAHVQDTMKLQNQMITVDAVVVWRIIDGRIAEAWDIPSTHAFAKL